MSAAEIDLIEMIGEVRRELAMRHRVYPMRVHDGRLNPRIAARQIDRMEAVLALLERVHADPGVLPDVVRERMPALI